MAMKHLISLFGAQKLKKTLNVAIMVGMIAPSLAATEAFANGIQVHRAPAWGAYTSGVELFINEPKHNQPAGTYNLASVPFQYRLRYGVCFNRYPEARVLARYDYNGTQCQPDTWGANAYWVQVYRRVFTDRNCNGGGQSGEYCITEVGDSTALNLSNVAPTAKVVTLQVYAKWIYNRVAFPITDDSPTGAGLSYPDYYHVVNICINVQSCGNGRIEAGEQCDDGNKNDGDGCNNACKIEQKLIIRKVSQQASVVAGQPINYTIFVKNPNPFPVNAVSQVYDAPGPGLTITQVPTSFCAINPQNNNVGCTIGWLAAGQEISIPITAQTSAGFACPGVVHNYTTSYMNQVKQGEASASTNVTCPAPQCGNGKTESGEQCDDGNQVNNDACTNACKTPRCGDAIIQNGEQCDDGNTSNGDGCSNSCQIEEAPKTNVRITKTTNGTNPVNHEAGTTFRIEVRNTSNVVAENVRVTDAAVPGITPTQVTSPCTITNNAVSCDFGTLAAGESKVATITAGIMKVDGNNVCSPGSLTNTAVVTTSTPESDTTDNTSSSNVEVRCPPPAADLTIIKDTASIEVKVNENVDFIIVAKNLGGTPAENVTITDTLPAQLDFVSANGCSANGKVITCSIGTLGYNDTSAPIIVRTKVNSSATNGMTVVNPAHVATTTTESNYNNNDDDASVKVLADATGCIDITKEAFDTNGNLIGTVPAFTFQLDGSRTTTNDSNGRARFDNVPAGSHVVSELLPSGWSQHLVTPNNGVVNVPAGNTCVSVNFKNRQIGGSSSSSSSSSSSDFSISKTDHESEVEPGDDLTYEIRVRNNSNQTVYNVTVTDNLPDEVIFDSCSDNCSRNGRTLTWNNLTFSPNEEKKFEVDVEVDEDADGTLVNNAYVFNKSARDETDVEEVDNDDDDDDKEIGIIKESNTSEVFPGGVIEYTVRIENTGDVTLEDLTVTDKLPSGASVVDAGNGKRKGSTLVWEIDELEDGDTWTATYRLAADTGLMPGSMLRNEVCVEDEDEDLDECANVTVSVIGNLPQTGYRNGGSAIQLRSLSRTSNESSGMAAFLFMGIAGAGVAAGGFFGKKYFI